MSIEGRLLRVLLLASVGVSLALAVATAALVRQKVGDLLDYQLEQAARTLLLQADDADRSLADDPLLHLEAQVWSRDGRLLWRTGDDLHLPADTPPGLSTTAAGHGRIATRVFTLSDAHRTVQVALELSLRDDLALEEGLEVLWPALLALGVLSLLIVWTVRRSLAPLRDLDHQLARRNPRSLAPIELPQAPQELTRPLATLNGLLARLDDALATHRRFVADAAHELRTPLAAIRLQASNVFTAPDPAAREAARLQLLRGIERAQHLAEQMLALARFEPGGSELAHAPVDLHALAQQALIHLSALAAARRIELALQGESAAIVAGDAEALRVLLDNLIGNAIKYGPQDSTVEVALERSTDDAAVTLRVRDEGPGIAPTLRERVFDRFQRGDDRAGGSGLGLAIVADIVRAHGARIELGDARPAGAAGGDQAPGLCVVVRFPAAATPANVATPGAEGRPGRR